MRAIRAVGRWLVALALLVASRLRFRRRSRRAVPPPPESRGASVTVTLLLLAAAVCSGGFVALYVLDARTQYLGLALGAAFLFLGASSIIASKGLVPQEERTEELEIDPQPDQQREAEQIAAEGAQGITRRGLVLSGVAAAGATGAALLVPAASMGPVLDWGRLRQTPWRAGRTLVDADAHPIVAADLEPGSFLTAFPDGGDRDGLDSSLVVVRLKPDELMLPPERADWAPEGICAYSRSCTHAGCAVSLFEYPTYEPTSGPPNLICPCHYSEFDPRAGGEVVGGPAGRPLPQVPLQITDDGIVLAAGEMSAPPGPAWSFVRE